MKIFRDAIIDIEFRLRNSFTFSLGNIKPCVLENEEKTELFHSLHNDRQVDAELKESEYCHKYWIKELKNNSTKRNYIENLYILELLETSLHKIKYAEMLNVLDIGSKNWFYAAGEYAYFKKYCEVLKLTGVEIDPNRLYVDLYSRKDYANYYIRGLSGTKYIGGSLMTLDGEYDFITWFLPFITPYPHQAWGLPKRLFNPDGMLIKAYGLLKTNGTMLIMNQGIAEAEKQKELFVSNNINFEELGEFRSTFIDYKHARYLFRVTKTQ